MFHIVFSIDVERDLRRIPSFYRNRILDAIERQLVHQPIRPAKNKKLLVNLTPPWKNDLAIWELRVGQYRVFYDVNEAEKEVAIRAVRKKLSHETTEDIV